MSRFRLTAVLAVAALLFTSDNLFSQIFPAQNYRQLGARRGAAAGAVVGGLIGGRNDRPALGIIVGGATGAIVGQAIGQRKDQRFYQQQSQQQYGQPYGHPYGHSGHYQQQPFHGQQGWQQPHYRQPYQPYQQQFSPLQQQLQPQPFIPQQQYQPYQHLPQQPYYQQPATPFFGQGRQLEAPSPGIVYDSNVPQIATPVPVSPPQTGIPASSSRLGLPPLPEIPSVVEPNSVRLSSPGPRPYSHGG